MLGWLGLQDSLLGPEPGAHHVPAPVLASSAMRNSFEAVPRELEESAPA